MPRKNTTPAAPANRRGTRPRPYNIDVHVSGDERDAIASRASAVGLAKSAYLRTLGMNQAVRSIADLEVAAQIAKVNADLGRYGGLMKLWLSEQRGVGATVADVNAALAASRVVLQEMRELAGRLCRG